MPRPRGVPDCRRAPPPEAAIYRMPMRFKRAVGRPGDRCIWQAQVFRLRWADAHTAPMFPRRSIMRHAPQRGELPPRTIWRVHCALCPWAGNPSTAGRHARGAHAEQLLDVGAYGNVQRYRIITSKGEPSHDQRRA